MLASSAQVVSDRVRLKQILVNLVSNAIKFTPSGAVTVEIDDDPATDRFRIAVIDTGLGIAEGDAARIFEPFDQAENAAAQTSAGTGLGLAIPRVLTRMEAFASGAEERPALREIASSRPG